MLFMEEYLLLKINKICDDIAEKDWSVQDAFLPAGLLSNLQKEIKIMEEKRHFRPARVGSGPDSRLVPEIRTDLVMWLDPDNLSVCQKEYWNIIDVLKNEINRNFYLNLREFEAHFTIYKPGAFYKKHIDQFARVKQRTISCILYLNENWIEDYGGQLRIYINNEDESESFLDVLPLPGTFVCFRSDKTYHEVLPANRERYSLTGWLKK